MAIAGSNDHVYVWFKDNTVCSGTSRDLDKYSPLTNFQKPPRQVKSKVFGMAMSTKDRVFTWYSSKRASSGTPIKLAQYKLPYPYKLPFRGRGGGLLGNRPSGPNSPSTPNQESIESLFELPSNVEITGNDYYMQIDFSGHGDKKPKISIPKYLVEYLPGYEGKVIFPDKICGFRVELADHYIWLDEQNRVLEGSEYYNNVPESSSLLTYEDGQYSDFYYEGLEFVGPMGPCKKGDYPWQFKFPLTQSGSLDPSYPNAKLLIYVVGARLNFLDSASSPKFKYKYPKFYKKDTLKKMIEFWNSFGKEDAKYPSIMEDICKEEPDLCKGFPGGDKDKKSTNQGGGE